MIFVTTENNGETKIGETVEFNLLDGKDGQSGNFCYGWHTGVTEYTVRIKKESIFDWLKTNGYIITQNQIDK